MRSEDSHLSDEELLLAADGELPAHRTKEVSEHLAACWDCRARRGRLEATIAGLVETRHAIFDPHLPPEAGRRALLKAHLSELAAGAQPARWSQVFHGLPVRRILTFGFASAVLVIFAAAAVIYRSRMQDSSSIVAQGPLEPSRKLTPGATRQVNLRDVCGAAADDGTVRVIPVSVQRQVFQEYGMEGAPSKDYEVDFLITPELGGSNDIRNLWPEPYYSTVWNAHVKDKLEDRLHQMVCDGELDLSTAQRDISADWILAYKKYFHTDRPL
jgi:hypothetical protein